MHGTAVSVIFYTLVYTPVLLHSSKESELAERVESLSASVSKLLRLAERNCDTMQIVHPESGVRTLRVRKTSVDAYCDQDKDGGGWTVIQRRTNGQLDFYRGWNDYLTGFGDLNKEHWLGLENIHVLTTSTHCSLRIDLWDANDTHIYAVYHAFYVDGASDNYRLHLAGYSGNAGDSLLRAGFGSANNVPFSTYDRDHDKASFNCASRFHGGWWYNKCMAANLNGRYYSNAGVERHNDGVTWFSYRNDTRSFVRTLMRIRSGL